LSVVSYKLDYYIFRHLKQFGYLRCDIILLFLIYSAGRYPFRNLCLPWHSVHLSLLPVQKCNNVRDLYELPDICPLNSHDLNSFISKYGAASLPEKAQDVDDLTQNLIDAWFGVEQKALLTTALISGTDMLFGCIQATAQDILNIHWDIN